MRAPKSSSAAFARHINDLAARLNLAPRGGHWNTGVSMLRSNALIGDTPQGFELGQALS